MKSWIEFYDYYLADLPGCTYYAAGNALRQAAQEFCQRTKALRMTVDPLTLTTDSIYDFDFTTNEVLVQVLWAKIDDQDLRILAPGEDSEGTRSIRAIDSSQFELFPDPTAGQILTMECAIKPSNTSDSIDDFLYDQYAEKIAYGAKARLMMQADKPYTNLQLAPVNGALFDAAIASATLRVARSYSNLPLRTRANFL